MSIIEITLKEQEEGRRTESFNILPSTSSGLQTIINGTLEVSSYTHQEENLPVSGVICVEERGCSSCLSLL